MKTLKTIRNIALAAICFSLLGGVASARGPTKATTVTVTYSNPHPSARAFSNLRAAKNYATKAEQLGYAATLHKHRGRYVVRYKLVRHRAKTFSGPKANQQAREFRAKLRKHGYQVRVRQGRPKAGSYYRSSQHSTRGIFDDIGKILEDVGNAGKKLIDGGAQVVDKIANDVDKAVKDAERKLKQAGRDISASLDFAGRYAYANIKPYATMAQDTVTAWRDLERSNRNDLPALARAIQRRDGRAVARILAERMLRNSRFRDVIEAAHKKRLGSLLIMVSGSGGYLGNGELSAGVAIDLSDLVYRRSRVRVSVFVSGGVSVGPAGGGSVGFALGYALNKPAKVGGPSLDLNVTLTVKAGINVGVSYDLTTAPVQFSGFTVGVSIGAQVGFSGGLSVTHVFPPTLSVTVRPPSQTGPPGVIGPPGGTNEDEKVVVSYRNPRWFKRSFGDSRSARGYQQQKRRDGYSTTLGRKGRQYVVSYRQSKYRSRTFTGRDAMRRAQAYRKQLQRRGYQTQLRVYRKRPAESKKFDPRQLHGKSHRLAVKIAKRHGYSVRIVSKDGRSYPVTRDYRRDRVNLKIVRGRVVKAYIG